MVSKPNGPQDPLLLRIRYTGIKPGTGQILFLLVWRGGWRLFFFLLQEDDSPPPFLHTNGGAFAKRGFFAGLRDGLFFSRRAGDAPNSGGRFFSWFGQTMDFFFPLLPFALAPPAGHWRQEMRLPAWSSVPFFLLL